MRKIITLIVCALSLASCVATKKTSQMSSIVTDSLNVNKVTSEQTHKVVDTTRTEQGKITITEIDFFPPTDVQILVDSSRAFNDLHDSPANISLDNFGNVAGAVKTIKQTVIESNIEEKGQSEDSSNQNESENITNVAQVDEQTNTHKETTPINCWCYIFYIILIFVAVLLYLKKIPIISWLKKILQVVLKILQ